MAADAAVVRAAQMGVAAAIEQYPQAKAPWLMASFNDGEDPHFRKALALTNICPADCPQPCIASCPPTAISGTSTGISIHTDLCFGCGRCEPLCPAQVIRTDNYQVSAASQMPDLLDAGIDAIEIHTRIGRSLEFEQLWNQLQPWTSHLKLVSISFNDGDGLKRYLHRLVDLMQPMPASLVWQVDGRPMSGDIGDGTTRATLHLAEKVLSFALPGFVQLAGGTNQATMPKARGLGISVSGAAFGSFARKLVAQAAEAAELDRHSPMFVEAISRARQLVTQVKQPASVKATLLR
ncbi:MAG: LdpA C-terminal domain-containing domain [Cyanobacteria bacterium P01_E01_bin.34]